MFMLHLRSSNKHPVQCSTLSCLYENERARAGLNGMFYKTVEFFPNIEVSHTNSPCAKFCGKKTLIIS